MSIRAFRPSDASAVAALITPIFPADVAAFAAYAQPGTARHLVERARGTESPSTADVFVAEEECGLVGCVDLHRTEDAAHIAYLAVARDYRSSGLGTALLRTALTRTPQPRIVSLDVFADNSGAVRFYRRLGFVEVGRSSWIRRPLPPSDGRLPLWVLQATPAEERRQQIFGFSQMRALRDSEVVTIGRVGASAIRLPCLTALYDDELLGSIGPYLPDARNVLCIETSPVVPLRKNAVAVSVGIRMEAPLSRLDKWLTHGPLEPGPGPRQP